MLHYTLQGMVPTNVKTVHQTSLLHIESNLGSPVAYPRPAFSATRRIYHAPINFDQKPKFLSRSSYAEISKLVVPKSMGAGARPSFQLSKALCISEKRPRNLARSPLLVGRPRKKSDRGQRPALPSKACWFAPFILAHKGSAPRRLLSYSPPSPNLVLTQPIKKKTCQDTLTRAATELSALPGFPRQWHNHTMASRVDSNTTDKTRKSIERSELKSDRRYYCALVSPYLYY